ncbi:MAG: hypothetical protein AB1782_12880 [Cyanobacteriota bacterium]
MSITNNAQLAKEVGKYLYSHGVPEAFADYLKARRWFRRKSETIKNIIFRDYAVLSEDPIEILTLIEIYYENFHSEVYYFPIMVQTKSIMPEKFETILEISVDDNYVSLYDAFSDIRFCSGLLKLIRQRKQVKSLCGVFSFYPMDILKQGQYDVPEEKIKLLSTEQSNTSIMYGKSLIMKNFRSIEYGLNPDFEITHFLTKQTELKNVPALMGYIEYQNQDKLIATAAVLQEYITNKGDCWNYTLIQLEQILRTAMRNICIYKDDQIKQIIKDFSKDFISESFRLGEITGAFHKALTTNLDDDSFKAENVSNEDIDSWMCFMVTSADAILDKINKNLSSYSPEVQERALEILSKKSILIALLKNIENLRSCQQKKIRIHGDYHLGQVLKTENDFVILDFEGEPIRTLEERRAKLLPHKDIAGMLRSFNYAKCTCLYELPGIAEEELNILKKWADFWEEFVCEAFLEGYLSVMRDEFDDINTFNSVLEAFMIDKAIYELDYEINNRPDWLKIPVAYLKTVVT